MNHIVLLNVYLIDKCFKIRYAFNSLLNQRKCIESHRQCYWLHCSDSKYDSNCNSRSNSNQRSSLLIHVVANSLIHVVVHVVDDSNSLKDERRRPFGDLRRGNFVNSGSNGDRNSNIDISINS